MVLPLQVGEAFTENVKILFQTEKYAVLRPAAAEHMGGSSCDSELEGHILSGEKQAIS